MYIKGKHIWWALLFAYGTISFVGWDTFPSTWDGVMSLLVDVDQWIINHAEYPGIFALFLGLLIGTVIIPETWPFVRKWLLGLSAREFAADFDDLVNHSARADFILRGCPR